MATTGSVSQRAMLVNLTVSNWSARKFDRKVSDDVARQHNASRDVGRYNKQLIHKDALSAVNKAIREIYAIHYELTSPWLDQGTRILSSAAYIEYAQRMRIALAAFEKAADDFSANYPQYINEQARRLNGMFDPAEYPATSAIRGKFAAGYALFPIPEQQDWRLDVNDAALALIREDMENAERVKQEAINGAMLDVYGRVVEKVGHMASRLRAYEQTYKNGKYAVENPFRDSLVDNVRELADLLPKLNITDDPKLNDLTSRIKVDLTTVHPSTLRVSQATREDVAAKAEAILAEVSEFFA